MQRAIMLNRYTEHQQHNNE